MLQRKAFLKLRLVCDKSLQNCRHRATRNQNHSIVRVTQNTQSLFHFDCTILFVRVFLSLSVHVAGQGCLTTIIYLSRRGSTEVKNASEPCNRTLPDFINFIFALLLPSHLVVSFLWLSKEFYSSTQPS